VIKGGVAETYLCVFAFIQRLSAAFRYTFLG